MTLKKYIVYIFPVLLVVHSLTMFPTWFLVLYISTFILISSSGKSSDFGQFLFSMYTVSPKVSKIWIVFANTHYTTLLVTAKYALFYSKSKPPICLVALNNMDVFVVGRHFYIVTFAWDCNFAITYNLFVREQFIYWCQVLF